MRVLAGSNPVFSLHHQTPDYINYRDPSSVTKNARHQSQYSRQISFNEKPTENLRLIADDPAAQVNQWHGLPRLQLDPRNLAENNAQHHLKNDDFLHRMSSPSGGNRESQLRAKSEIKSVAALKLRSASEVRSVGRSLSMSRSASSVRYKADRRDSSPPKETASYQGLDLTSFPSNFIRRAPRRRAVIVGINYVLTPDILLRGCCNDASALAATLINLCDFLLNDIVLLVDSFPAKCYRSLDHKDDKEQGDPVLWRNRQPARRNILMALNWLRSDTLPGDVLLFYFAGHGVQVDDMSGWEGEGYDEAILPMDFCGEEINAITAVMIRNVLLNVANDVQVTIILDCNGGQTMLDPSGTGKWNFIKGVKQRGVWPFVTDATDKVARAVYDATPWTDKAMKRRGARPRFVPGVDVSSTQELLDPILQKPNSQISNKVKGYLFASAPHSQSAIEAKMSAIRLTPVDRYNNIVTEAKAEKTTAYHGVFSWCFMTALQDLMLHSVSDSNIKSVSYRRLAAEVERRVKLLKSPQGGLPKLNQIPELTFYRSGGSDTRDYFLWSFGGRRPNVPYSDNSELPFELPYFPYEQEYLSIWDAEEQLSAVGENKRRNDPAFMRSATLSHRSFNPSGTAQVGAILGHQSQQTMHDYHQRMLSSPQDSSLNHAQKMPSTPVSFTLVTQEENSLEMNSTPLKLSPSHKLSMSSQPITQRHRLLSNPGPTRQVGSSHMRVAMPESTNDPNIGALLAQHDVQLSELLEAAAKGEPLVKTQLKVSTQMKPAMQMKPITQTKASSVESSPPQMMSSYIAGLNPNLPNNQPPSFEQTYYQQPQTAIKSMSSMTSLPLPSYSNQTMSSPASLVKPSGAYARSNLPSPLNDAYQRAPILQSNIPTQHDHYPLKPSQSGLAIKRRVVT